MRAEALGDEATVTARLNNRSVASITLPAAAHELERVADVPIYSADALVRRAPSLQLTADARAPMVSVSSGQWRQLGLQAGQKLRVSQGAASAVLPVREDATLADQAVRVPAGHADTAGLGPMFGPISLEKA